MRLAYRLERLGFPALYEYSHRMDHEINMEDGGAAHVTAARELARRGHDVVVSGHTHVGTYLDTGDGIRRRLCATLDLDRRECQLREFRGRRVPVEREEPWQHSVEGTRSPSTDH
jgi:hypothetical protein